MPGWAAAVHHAVIDEDELANQDWDFFSPQICIIFALLSKKILSIETYIAFRLIHHSFV